MEISTNIYLYNQYNLEYWIQSIERCNPYIIKIVKVINNFFIFEGIIKLYFLVSVMQILSLKI